jgi:glutathione peroxidase
VVNTASKCGFTPQYQGLETLYRKYFAQGFVVLGFPCNQFGAQEPGDAAEIAGFCSRTYNVTFPMFGKIDVNGAGDSSALPVSQRRSQGSLWEPGRSNGIFRSSLSIEEAALTRGPPGG